MGNVSQNIVSPQNIVMDLNNVMMAYATLFLMLSAINESIL